MICKQRQVYFLLSEEDALYFFFLSSCSGWNFSYYRKEKWYEQMSLFYSDLRGKAFRVSPVTMRLVMDFSTVVFVLSR